jgi:hypothetical protein
MKCPIVDDVVVDDVEDDDVVVVEEDDDVVGAKPFVVSDSFSCLLLLFLIPLSNFQCLNFRIISNKKMSISII